MDANSLCDLYVLISRNDSDIPIKDSNKLRCGREKVISCPALYRDW